MKTAKYLALALVLFMSALAFAPHETLTISSSAGGSVTTPGEGTFVYVSGGSVSVVATAQSGHYFVDWTGTAVTAGKVADPNSAITTVLLDGTYGTYTLHANFAENPSLSISSTEGGSVNTPGEGTFSYDYGTTVSISALADSGHHFVNWTGMAVDAGAVANPHASSTTVTVKGDHTLIANFFQACPSVNTRAAGNVAETSARLEAQVLDSGAGLCDGWFRYWRKNNQAQTELTTPIQSSLRTGQQYTETINGLLPGTTYCCQAVVENSGCTGEGNIQEFTTSGDEPSPANVIHVDDDAINDPGPGNLFVSDPLENGTPGRPYDSIQEAIAAAQDLDTILVHEGTYYETPTLMGKPVTVTRFVPGAPEIAAYPVIDAQSRGSVITADHGEGPHCVLSGFVLTGGRHDNGSAIACIGASPTVRNCLIVGNRSNSAHGATVRCELSDSLFENCTIVDNYAGANGTPLYSADSNLVIKNSILWGNAPGEILVASGTAPFISYSDIQGAWPGPGNINLGPLFTLPGYWSDPTDPLSLPVPPDHPFAIWIHGDYHLLSQTGRWDPMVSGWIADGLTSPCVDTGDPLSAWADEPKPNGGRINMGAFGGTDQASLSLHLIPIVAHWTFDESLGATASDSVGDNHGAVYGGAWTDGILNGALQFDGVDDFVDCGDNPALAPHRLTASMWIYPQASSASRTVLRKAGDAIKDYEFELFAAQHPTFSFGNRLQSVVLYSSSKLPLSEWTHIALTRDETNAAIYVNGAHLIGKTYSFFPMTSDDNLIIGGGTTQPYQGKIDDVQIYESVLSAEEIEGLATDL